MIFIKKFLVALFALCNAVIKVSRLLSTLLHTAAHSCYHKPDSISISSSFLISGIYKESILIFLFLTVNISVFSQIYPVSTVTSVTPPYPYSLDGFADQSASKISLQVVVNDVTLTNYPVKLRLVMKSNNVKITTSNAFISEPLYLNGGETMVLSAADLASYFLAENLDFSGFSKSQYLRTGQLPDGIYQISFEVLDYARNSRISSSFPAFVYLFVNDPPILNTPQASKQIEITGQQNIIFNWAFRQSPFSRPGLQPEYQLDIWEVYPDNLDPYMVVRSSQPVYSEKTGNTSFQYSNMQPLLIPGRRYAWRVQVIDPQGRTAFKENGNSNVRWFKYGTSCDAPVLKAGKPGTTHLNLEWETPQLQKDFTIRYKPDQPADAPWYSTKTSYLSYKLDNLKANSGYIIEVSGKCGMQESPASNQLTLRTNVDLNFQCGGKGNIPEIANKIPLLQLQRGNFIKAGDFEVEVYQVEGTNGVFNGKGYVLVPLFNFIKLDAVLENVQVNSDFQLIGGSIRTIYDVNNSAMVNLTDIANKLKSDTKTEENDFAEIAEVKVNAGDSITAVLVSGNTVTVRTSNGNITTKPIEANKIISITAPEGQQYIVDGNTKTVYTSSSPGGEAPQQERLNPSSPATKKYTVSFQAHPNQFYGFDNPSAQPVSSWYKSKTMNGNQIFLPWKSIESGRYDKITAIVTGSPVDSVFYSRNSASMVMAAPGKEKNEKHLMITGEGNNDEDELFAWYRTYSGDSVKKQENYLAGALNVVSYDKKTVKLELVEVNDATAPNPEYIQEQLNSIYKQAVVEWKVTQYSQKVQVTFENDIFKNSDPDNDMNYTESEKQLINKLKEDNNIEKDKLYLFIINTKTDDKLLKGYMPLNRNFGFVFTKAHKDVDDLIRTIAHEPGHGAFRLKHTFSQENSYIEPQFTTDNLMDYASSEYLKKNRLVKYQWDECHDWDLGLNWGEGEEEGEGSLPCLGIFDDCDDVLKKIDAIKKAYKDEVNINGKIPKNLVDKVLLGTHLKLGNTDFDKIYVCLYGNPDFEYSINPKDYSEYEWQVTQYEMDPDKIIMNRGFEFKFNGKHVLRVFIEDFDSNIELKFKELKKYIFEEEDKPTKAKDPVKQIIDDDGFVPQAGGDCFATCKKIIAKFDKDYIVSWNLWALASYNGTKDIYIHKECYEKAIKALDKLLEGGIPVIVGVDWRSGGGNFDGGITDHWVVIVGRGNDNKGNYYTYFEVAQDEELGYSSIKNRFYLTTNGYLEAINPTVSSKGLKPIVTAIRYEPDDCACDRNNYSNKNHNIKCGEIYNHQSRPKGTLIKIR